MDEKRTQFPQFGVPESTPIAPAKSSRGLIIKIIVGVVVLAVVGVGVSLATRIWDPLWNPFRPSPEKVIEEMAEKMKTVKTVHSDVKIELSVEETEESAFNLSVTLASDSDTTDPENLKSAVGLDIVMAFEGMQFSLAGEVKTIRETYFVKLTTIPALPFLQPFLAMLGIDLSKMKNQWIKIDKEVLEGLQGINQPEMSKEKQKRIIDKIESIFKDKKLYLVKKELPDEKIGNVKNYHYLVALNKEEVKKVIPECLEFLAKEVGEEFSGGDFFGASIRAKIARTQADMSRMRTVAEIIYMNEGYSYANVNCQNEEMKLLCDEIEENVGTEPIIHQSKDEYCAYTPLLVEGYYYCIDSGFHAVITDIFPEASGYCNGDTFVCPGEATIPNEDIGKIGEEEFLKELDEFLDKVGELTADFWIGKKDGLLYGVKVEKEIDMSAFEEGVKGKMTIKIDVNLSNFNQPVKIEAPEKFLELKDIIPQIPLFIPGGAPMLYP